VPRSRQLLCIVYGAIALLALIATWSQNLSYFRPEDGLVRGFVLATARFWPDTLTTPAGVSVTVDLGLFFLAAAVFMVLEARRLGIRFVWLYVILGFLVAISVTFPLFLIARERRLATQADVELAGGDRIGLWAFGAAMALFSLWTLGR
jgi:Terpene cyclase DEP1